MFSLNMIAAARLHVAASSTGAYSYVWETDKSWARTCRRLDLTVADGTIHQAIFKFL